MAKIFITGSTDGLGLLTAKELIKQGHDVVLHARNEKRKREVIDKVEGAKAILIADLSGISETIQLSNDVNKLGTFDVIIHNAGLYDAAGIDLLSVNTLAPYILTCIIKKPKRLIYLSSKMHEGGKPKLENFKTEIHNINYSDTKLHVVLLCKAVARLWPDVFVNAINPGWVPTKMGGKGAPDSFESGYQTQVWLALSDDAKAKVTGRYFYHMKESHYSTEADDLVIQERFLNLCKEITGVSFPMEIG